MNISENNGDRYGPVRCPPRGLVLTPLDFYDWNTLKIEVYQICVQIRVDKINILTSAHDIPHLKK